MKVIEKMFLYFESAMSILFIMHSVGFNIVDFCGPNYHKTHYNSCDHFLRALRVNRNGGLVYLKSSRVTVFIVVSKFVHKF